MISGTGSPLYQPVALDYKTLAATAYTAYEKRYPAVYRGFDARQQARCREDFSFHLRYLGEALAIGDAAIFVDYARWAQVLLVSRHLPPDCLASSLDVLNRVLNENLPPGIRVRTGAILTEAITALATASTTVPSFFTEGDPLDQEAREYLRALIAADRARARALVMALVEQDTPLRDIYLHLIQPVLYEVGRLWQVQQITVAQEHYITAATQQILAQLYLPVAREVKRANRRGRTLVAACAGHELHEVGIRMVADFFEMDGWDTYYTGANTPVESIVKMVADERASAVALSSTMCYHIPHLHRLILSLRDDRETASVKILVGGYPFNLVHGLWQKIGADACATSAQDAVRAVNWMMDEEGLNRHAPR